MPEVSIIIPTYNRATLLPRAIGSVLAQTFADWELIVVDDCSTDDTGEVVSGFRDSRIRYLRHAKNMRAPAARNTGIRESVGPFVAFLDSDNEWLPEKLERQMEMFRRMPATVGVVYANNTVVDETSGTETVWAFGLRGNLYREFLQRPFMDFITPVIRRECLDRIGPLDVDVPSYQEWDTFLRISRHYEFDFVPEILAVYYVHRELRISKGPLADAVGWEHVFRKHRSAMLAEFSPRVLIEHHRNLSHLYRKGGGYLRMARNYLLAWRYDRIPSQS